MVIVGIDPDVKAHGVAIYRDGKLVELKNCTLVEIVEANFFDADLFAIENVKGCNAVFEPKGVKMKAYAKQARARNLGELQHSQTELERFLDNASVDYKLYKISSKWKSAKVKREFEMMTEWTTRSNEDTRSAAYFGYRAVCDMRQAKLLRL